MIDEAFAEHARTNLDRRFRVALDLPDCFVCGKTITRANFVSVETGASTPVHAHAECCDGHFINGRPDQWLFDRMWAAVRAAITGARETANPAAAVVRGGFR